jgi:hypothetical protein
MADPLSPNPPSLRYVDVPCMTGKHPRSVLTFRSYNVAAMFCIPCEMSWSEPTSHPALRDIPVDVVL